MQKLQPHKSKESVSSEENEFENAYANLEFNVKYETKMGQTLHICGNVIDLGNGTKTSHPNSKLILQYIQYGKANLLFLYR